MAECIECGEEYADKRYELGYQTCLECGDSVAHTEAVKKSKRIAPLFNKGAYQYITDDEDLTTIGKKV